MSTNLCRAGLAVVTMIGLLIGSGGAQTLAGMARSGIDSSAFAKSDDGAPAGHPTADMANPLGPYANRGNPMPPVAGPLPTVSPLASGAYVNFESPPVKALALNAAATRLLAVNAPAGSLTILDVTPGASPPLRVVQEIPVGIDPVSVAIQPGDRFAWVANFISDNISVVDLQTGVVIRVIDVGDEPVNVLFTPDGAYAYVVLQGPHALSTPPFDQFSSLVTVETGTGQIVGTLALDMNTARAAVYHPQSARIIIAALHSGNNTTVVGEQIVREFGPSADGDSLPAIEIVRQFSATAAAFAQGSLAPYPDASPLPGAPLVHRIVPDAGKASPWSTVLAILDGDDGDGKPDPAMIALYAQETGATNAAAILQRVMADAKDTADHDLVVIDARSPAAPTVERIIGGVGTTLTGLALDPAGGRVIVTAMEARNTVRLKGALRGHFMDHQVVFVDWPWSPIATPPQTLDLHAEVPQFNQTTVPNPAAIAASLANPVDVVVSPDGRQAYVASLGTGRIGVIDLTTGRPTARIDVGRGTRSLTLDAAGRRLFAYNRTDHSVAQVDVTSPTPVLAAVRPLFNAEPQAIRNGRDFLYSTRLSNNFGSSCAMCHLDAGLDHLAWDLGDAGATQPDQAPHNVCNNPNQPCMVNHPLKGPMVTQSLRGLRDHEAFHWRGDKPQFVDFAEAFESLLGGPAISPQDMLAFDAFIKTVEYPPNPFWNRDNSPKDPAFANGAVIYTTGGPMGANCQACHMVQHDGAALLPGFTDDGGMDLGFLFAQVQEVTQLRALYKKFPSDRYNGVGLLHDGRIEREDNGHALETFLRRFFRNLNAQSRSDLIAMVTAFPTNATNVVGWQTRIRGAASPQQQADIGLMITQSNAAPSRCDVIAQGRLSGIERGFVYQRPEVVPPADQHLLATFRSDTGELISLSSLLGLAQSGTLVVTATPPGSGARLAIDWDGDCILNGLDPFPRSNADFNRSGAVSVQDIFDFLSALFADDPTSDFNWSGSVSVQDIFDFLSAYFAGGCP